MLSNQVIQKSITELKNVIQRDIDVIENQGRVIASTISDNISLTFKDVKLFLASKAEHQLIEEHQFFKVFDNNICEFIVRIKGNDEYVFKLGKIVAFHLQALIEAYKKEFDKDNFIKNLLLDNLLLVDIYSRAKKLDIKNETKRIVYVIEVGDVKDINSFDLLRKLFPEKDRDFITSVDKNNIILVKELEEEPQKEYIESIAKFIIDTFNTELLTNVYVAIGSVVNDLKNISSSYKEAKMALEVGKIFEENKSIANYEELGIGRLICQLPITLCNMFVEEVLKGTNIKEIDEEMLITINKFFENSLNVSETSRQLYIHRNTLVYRLDKLQKNTGLDLRSFDDAIIFKITLMVNKYMEYRKVFSY